MLMKNEIPSDNSTYKLMRGQTRVIDSMNVLEYVNFHLPMLVFLSMFNELIYLYSSQTYFHY